MKRVKKGEKYWSIYLDDEELFVPWYFDNRMPSDDRLYEFGNYFHTKEEAEAMAEKLRAVLKGAGVIEMPSDEEICKEANNHCGYEKENVAEFVSYHSGWHQAIEWLKSKIMK